MLTEDPPKKEINPYLLTLEWPSGRDDILAGLK